MIELTVQVPPTLTSDLHEIDLAIQRGINNGVRQSAQRAYALVGPRIPIRTGQTRRRLRVTYSKQAGQLVARIGVRAPRAHIMRFYELGTKTHGHGGGPLPAHHVLAQAKAEIQPTVEPTIESNVRMELAKFGF